jgi:NAD(P)-dependent dehydrogenase (short-subunit alcohol dehydrogenase family)
MTLLEGRQALITGAASGIGLATARRLHKEGARVVVVDLSEAAGKEAADEVEGLFVRADVTSSDEVASAFEQAEAFLGGIDLAYMNAGVTSGITDIDALTDEEYLRVRSVNVDGVVFGVREAVRSMKRSGGGSIVATASIAGLNAYPPDPIYGLTKHAVVGLVRALGPLLQPHGITINAICPGIVETPLLGDGGARLKELGFPLIAPEDVAEAVVRAVTGGETGDAWVVQPGREPLAYKFRGVPGPRTPGAEGMEPPWERL